MLSSGIAIENEGSGEPLVARGQLLPFGLVTSLFFLWGVPNNLNDVLIRQFMKSFALNRVEAGLVQSAFYLGYFFLAIPAALIMRRHGYKAGLITGLLLFATGAALFWPAAIVGKYWFFLAALFVIASGLSFLETASNPFITQMGAPATAARRLNFSQAFNTLGSIAGVLAGTVFIFSGVELTTTQVAAQKAAGTYATYLRHETMRVVVPYLVLGAIALTLALLFVRVRFPEVVAGSNAEADGGRISELFRRPHFLFAVLAQFLYIGAQVGTWSYFIQYVQDYTHQPEKHAGLLLTGTLGAFALGRFSAPLLMKYIAGSTADDALCHGKRAPAALRRVTARVGGHVGGLSYQLLHVDHVPDDLRSWTGRVGAAGQAGRVAARDVDRWRSHTDACDGMDISACWRPCLRLHRAAGGIRCCRHFQLVSRTTESLARIVCVRRSEGSEATEGF